MCACAVLPNTKYFSNVTRKGPRSYRVLFYCPKPSSSFKRQWLESTITKLPSLLPFPLFLLDVFEHSFVLFRKFLSSKSFRFSSRVRGPSKERGFVTKRILKKLNLWGRLVVKTVKKCRNHCKKGWKNCPPHVIASPLQGFPFLLTTYSLFYNQSHDIWICVTRAPLILLKSLVALSIFQSLAASK